MFCDLVNIFEKLLHFMFRLFLLMLLLMFLLVVKRRRCGRGDRFFFVGAASGVFVRGKEETMWKRRLTVIGSCSDGVKEETDGICVWAKKSNVRRSFGPK